MKNIFIIESLLNFLKQSQRSKKLWIKFKKTQFLIKIIKLLFESKLICGYSVKKDFILIFLKYNGIQPTISSYKVYSKPNKKILMKKQNLFLYKKKNPQSFFFIINIKEILIFSKKKFQSGLLLFKIN